MESALVRSLVQGLPLPAVLIGRDARIVVMNPPARALFGDAAEGRHHMLTFRQPALLDAILAAQERGEAGQARHIVASPAREAIYRVTVSPVAGEGQAGALCLFEDQSDQEHVSQMRRDFVANVSHELRTPLTALLGFIETLKGAARDDPAARERFLGIMEREAGRMNRLVQDLLHLSRVESEERVRPTEPVDVAALVAMSVTALRPMADEAGVTIAISGLPGPILVPGDADQLTQVFQNLIENAVKYGGVGKRVEIRIARPSDPQGLRVPAVEIAVSDAGEGIDAIHLPRLTERFYRVDSHRSREKGGTGLGLAIVKHIVNRHRGRLRIDSERGKGSTFTVLLPEK